MDISGLRRAEHLLHERDALKRCIERANNDGGDFTASVGFSEPGMVHPPFSVILTAEEFSSIRGRVVAMTANKLLKVEEELAALGVECTDNDELVFYASEHARSSYLMFPV